jgi:glucose-1-phosphate adenylyltransferase
VTLVYKKLPEARPGKAYVVNVAADGRITGIAEKDKVAAGDNLFMEALLIDCSIFTNAVRQAYAQGKQNFFTDVIGAELKRLRVFGYGYSSYAARITSIPDYYKASMDLLNLDNLRTVFKPGLHIRTKIKDEAPAKYMEEALARTVSSPTAVSSKARWRTVSCSGMCGWVRMPASRTASSCSGPSSAKTHRWTV